MKCSQKKYKSHKQQGHKIFIPQLSSILLNGFHVLLLLYRDFREECLYDDAKVVHLSAGVSWEMEGCKI